MRPEINLLMPRTKMLSISPGVIYRVLFALAGISLWFTTQSVLGSRGFSEGVGDGMHAFLSPATMWLADRNTASNMLLIFTSALIDALGCFLILSGVLGRSVRPLIGLFLLFALRQICQSLTALPPPEGMIWRYPGFPSLFVTYTTENDFFFSGHTAIAVYGAMELARLRRRWITVTAVSVAFVEALTVLVLRAHYTMDVFAAILAAAWAVTVASRLAETWDKKFAIARQFNSNAES